MPETREADAAVELREVQPERGSGSSALGDRLGGRYRLDELLARGATADVYRGTDEHLGRKVAVKVFDSVLTELNSQHRQRLEMRVLASLNHPNLIAVYDGSVSAAGSADSTRPRSSYLVMELVQGATLADLIRSSPQLGAERVRQIGASVAAALEVVHHSGFIHRDVKPANILMADDGTAKLTDFGLARILRDDRLTSRPLLMGTAPYFSPEQVEGAEIGSASDVYSLGLVLLEALTGNRVYPGEAVESALARLSHRPTIPPGIPASMRELLGAMTATEPADRPSAAAVRRALTAPLTLAAAGPTTVPTAPVPVQTDRPRTRRGTDLAAAVAASVLALVLMIATAWWVGQGSAGDARIAGLPPTPATGSSSTSATTSPSPRVSTSTRPTRTQTPSTSADAARAATPAARGPSTASAAMAATRAHRTVDTTPRSTTQMAHSAGKSAAAKTKQTAKAAGSGPGSSKSQGLAKGKAKRANGNGKSSKG